MAGIFISYRRDDSQGFAGRLADDLTERFGPEYVFRDIEIPIGSDFTEVLHRAIAASDALVVVIGRQWAARSEHGYGSRLFEPTDWMRTEIEAAFALDKQVVPVLVGEASMPAPDELPASIRRLVRLQAAFLSDRRWDRDLDELAGRLRLLCPALAAAAPPARDDEASPGAALREIGERVFDEIASRRRPGGASRGFLAQRLSGLLHAVGRGLKKLIGAILVIGLLYAGLRLFGDADTLRMLDKMQARLLVGWVRLQGYLAHLR